MLCAIATGQLAARSIVGGLTPEQHIESCRKLLLPAFRWSTLIRRSLAWPLVPYLAQIIPGKFLYRFVAHCKRLSIWS